MSGVTFTELKLARAALALALCFSTPAWADEVDRYLEGQIRALHIPGLSLAVVRNGHIVKAAGYGFANLELQVPATPATVYEIGSNTKQFTAAAVMLLVEEGRIDLEDPITRHLPEAPPAWGPITVRHLLTHTSGIQNHVAVPGWLGVFKTSLLGETTPSRDELLRMFFALPLEFEPGATWAYDNTGYYLLGVVVERASGRPFWKYLEDKIFRPLGMTATRDTDPQPVVPHRASGYEWVAGAFQNRPVLRPPVAFSAGSLLSSVEDLAKWDAALHTEKLLGRASLERIWTPARTRDGVAASFDYGLGWFVDAYHGHRLVQHSGGTPGFSSTIYRFRADGLTVILLSNHGDRFLDQLAIDVAGLYLPALKRPEASADPDPRTTARLRAVISGLREGKHDPAVFTTPMRLFLGTATGKAFWQWVAAHGELESLVYSDREEVPEGRVLRYAAVLGGNRYWFSVVLDREGRIAQIRWW